MGIYAAEFDDDNMVSVIPQLRGNFDLYATNWLKPKVFEQQNQTEKIKNLILRRLVIGSHWL